MPHTVEIDLHGSKVSIETGKIAKQAGGSVVVRSGDSVVLVTATSAEKPKPGASFFPLTVENISAWLAGAPTRVLNPKALPGRMPARAKT